jgi:hypothetical protein
MPSPVRILPPIRTVPGSPVSSHPARMDPVPPTPIDEFSVLLRRLSELPAVDFVHACRLLAALETFSARLSDTEKTQFSRLLYSTAHAVSLQRSAR